MTLITRAHRFGISLSLFFLAAFLSSTQALAAREEGCEFAWTYGPSGAESYLRIDETWPLLHFLENQPILWPQRKGAAAREPAKLEVEWQPRPEDEPLPRLKKVGVLGGISVYEIYYSPTSKILVQERGDWGFCPIWSWTVDESDTKGAEPSHLFEWENRKYLSTRVFFPGMGALQTSYFFSFHEGQIRHIGVDLPAMRATLEEQGWEIYHRNGGFREGRLEWQNWAWQEETDGRVTLRVVFTRRERSLVMKEIEILPEDELWKTHELGYGKPQASSR